MPDRLRRSSSPGSATRADPGRRSASAAAAPAARARADCVISSPSKTTLPARRPDEPEQRPAERRLPAARLADEPEHLALAEVERDVVDRLAPGPPRGRCSRSSEAAPDRVVRLQAADGDERAVGRSRSAAAAASGFLGNGDLLSLERARAALGDSRRRAVQPAEHAAVLAEADLDRVALRRTRASRRGSADGTGSRAAGRSGSAARRGSSAARSCRARSSSAAARACTDAPAPRRRRAPSPPRRSCPRTSRPPGRRPRR